MFNMVDLSDLIIINGKSDYKIALVMFVICGFMFLWTSKSAKEYYNSKEYLNKVKRQKALRAKKKVLKAKQKEERRIKWC